MGKDGGFKPVPIASSNVRPFARAQIDRRRFVEEQPIVDAHPAVVALARRAHRTGAFGCTEPNCLMAVKGHPSIARTMAD